MKKLALLITFNLLLITLQAQQPVINWKKSYGGSKSDDIQSIDVTKDGKYYYVTGLPHSKDGNVDSLHGPLQDYWVLKLDTLGTIIWKKSLGGFDDDYSKTIIATNDGGCLVGGSVSSNDADVTGNHGNGDFWVVKLSAAGSIDWQKTYGSGGDELISDIKQTTSNNYILYGYSTGGGKDLGNYTNKGMTDDWVVEIDSVGTLLWQKSFGSTGDDAGKKMDITPEGEYVLSGDTRGNDGDFTGNHGGDDGYIIKLDKNGNKKWIKMYGSSASEFVEDIKVIDANTYVIAGTSAGPGDGDLANSGGDGTIDYWIMATDSMGNLKWSKCYGSSGQDDAFAIEKADNGDIIVVGDVAENDRDVSGIQGYASAWIIRLDPYTGNLKGKATYGGTIGIAGRVIKKDKAGRFLIGCENGANDNFVTDAKGMGDFFIMSLTWDYVTAINSIPMEQYGFSNAPNPFSENTTITYQLPAGTKQALLQVYTMQGVLVKKQVLNVQSTQAGLLADDMAAGVYLCSIVADGVEVGVKEKMVVVK